MGMNLNMDGGLLAGLEGRLERMERPPVLTITTDFGQHDGYVGTMKGVIYTLLPDAKVVDISHLVPPQQIHDAAFILYRIYRYFPASTVHIAVVDPGVGSSRRPIVLVTGHGIFVGPDNGIFTYVLRAEQDSPQRTGLVSGPAWAGGMWGVAPHWADEEPVESQDDEDGEDGDDTEPATRPPVAYHLVNPDYWLPTISGTFHGRDIFAPAAAHLASGAHPDRMGQRVDLASLVTLPLSAPRVQKLARGTTITGQIVYIDHFGNIITNLPERLMAPVLEESGTVPTIEVGDYRIKGLANSYADVREGQPVALMGSENLLEVAVRNASAAQRMKVRIGDAVRIVVGKRDSK